MTQSPFEKLIVLAAASGMTAAEFRSALNVLEVASPQEIDSMFKRVRNHVRHVDVRFSGIDRDFERASLALRDVITLVRASGVPPQAAAQRISAEFLLGDAERALPPFNHKEGFARWVERVSRVVGESALLNAAVAAFGPESRHGDAWTLSRS